MKILIVNNMAPFAWGGAEELAAHLKVALFEAGHEAEVLRIPFRWEPASRIPSQMLLVRGLELANVDRVVALKFPAYLIRHPHKSLWLLHQYRQAYDLFAAGKSELADTPEGEGIRRSVLAADDEAFGESHRIFVNSEVTRDRLWHFSHVRGEILRPPLNDPDLFTGGPSEGYLFAGGRVNDMKRQHLLIQALALTPSTVRLLVAGPPDHPDDASRLERLVDELDLRDRVRLVLRFSPRAEIASYVNGSAAVACIPYDEDSLSYVAMEGAAAGKPILSTIDSGGVLALVKHGETGWLAQPTIESIAEGLTQLSRATPTTLELGAAARNLWTRLGLTWQQAVGRLLA